MKKVKIILLLIGIIFFLSGCRATYLVTITNNDQFHETINLYPDDYEEKDNMKNFKMPILTDYNESAGSESLEKIPGYSYYDVDNSNEHLNLKHTFKLKEYKNSSAINECFEFFNSAINSDGNYILSTSNGFTCFNKYPNLNNATIMIKLDNEVIKSNADNVKDNVYTWNITKENSGSKSIFIQYKPDQVATESNTKKDNTLKYVLITLGVLVTLMLSIFLYNKNKYNKN